MFYHQVDTIIPFKIQAMEQLARHPLQRKNKNLVIIMNN